MEKLKVASIILIYCIISALAIGAFTISKSEAFNFASINGSSEDGERIRILILFFAPLVWMVLTYQISCLSNIGFLYTLMLVIAFPLIGWTFLMYLGVRRVGLAEMKLDENKIDLMKSEEVKEMGKGYETSKYKYYRFIQKDILITDEFEECYKVIDRCENSFLSFAFSAFSGKLTKFPDDIRHSAITVWNRKNFSGIYDSVNSTTNELFNIVNSKENLFEENSNLVKLGIAICACLLAFTFVKTGNIFSYKCKIRICDVCRDILCDYCDDPEEVFYIVCRTSDSLRGKKSERDIAKTIFDGISKVVPNFASFLPNDTVWFFRNISNRMRTNFDQHF